MTYRLREPVLWALMWRRQTWCHLVCHRGTCQITWPAVTAAMHWVVVWMTAICRHISHDQRHLATMCNRLVTLCLSFFVICRVAENEPPSWRMSDVTWQLHRFYFFLIYRSVLAILCTPFCQISLRWLRSFRIFCPVNVSCVQRIG